MRFVIPLLLSAVFAAGTAAAEPNTSAAGGNMPLSPNNCGTPDVPKTCPGMTRGTPRAHAQGADHRQGTR